MKIKVWKNVSYLECPNPVMMNAEEDGFLSSKKIKFHNNTAICFGNMASLQVTDIESFKSNNEILVLMLSFSIHKFIEIRLIFYVFDLKINCNSITN